jgi:glycosyltransferase involved in cell wall biosynthesis
MAASCPVVTSTGGACPEVAGDAAILVDPKDINSIAAGIIRGLTDSRLREQLRERGRTRSQEFTWENSARQTIDMLEGLAGSRHRSRSKGNPDASVEL